MSAPVEVERGWFAVRWERLNSQGRVTGIDLARGLAVMGMLAAHLLWIEQAFDWTDAPTWIAVVDGRSSILFATLAGVSIGLVTGGRAPVTGDDRRVACLRLAVRAGLLWLVGILLITTGVPVFVILPAYAILFLLAIPLVGLRARALFALAAGLAVVMPFVQVRLDEMPFWQTVVGHDVDLALGWHYPFPVWIAFVVAGLGLARAGVRSLGVQIWTLGVGAGLAVIGYGLDAASGSPDPYWSAVWTAEPHSGGVLEVIGSGGFALAVIAACLLVCRTVIGWVLLPLRAVGAMPLTAYTVQLVVWAVVAAAVLGDPSDLVGFRDLEPFLPFVLWTIAGCTAWALLIGRGPLEWGIDRVARLLVRRR